MKLTRLLYPKELLLTGGRDGYVHLTELFGIETGIIIVPGEEERMNKAKLK